MRKVTLNGARLVGSTDDVDFYSSLNPLYDAAVLSVVGFDDYFLSMDSEDDFLNFEIADGGITRVVVHEVDGPYLEGLTFPDGTVVVPKGGFTATGYALVDGLDFHHLEPAPGTAHLPAGSWTRVPKDTIYVYIRTEGTEVSVQSVALKIAHEVLHSNVGLNEIVDLGYAELSALVKDEFKSLFNGEK